MDAKVFSIGGKKVKDLDGVMQDLRAVLIGTNLNGGLHPISRRRLFRESMESFLHGTRQG